MVFPDHKKGATLKILSSNQLQYLLKTCHEAGKSVAPVELKHLQTDIKFDNHTFNKVLKVCEKNRYCKVEPGITLLDLNKQLASVGDYAVPLTYPRSLIDGDSTVELSIQENLLCL